MEVVGEARGLKCAAAAQGGVEGLLEGESFGLAHLPKGPGATGCLVREWIDDRIVPGRIRLRSFEWVRSAVEEVPVVEEPLQFDGGGFRGVGGVADVDHHIDAEIAADGALGGLGGVGGAEEVADAVDGVVAGQGEGDDGGLLHEGLDLGEEGLGGDVGVVFAQEGVVEAEHPDAPDPEIRGFEAGEDLSDEGLGDGVGFEQYESGFL